MSTGALTAEQTEIVATVRAFVDKDVIPVASELEHADEFPTQLVETIKGMGLFGTTIPEEYGGLGLGIDTYALIQMELARGWVTLPGIMNGSFIARDDAPPARHGGAAAEIAPAARGRRDPRCVLDVGAARRLGCPGDPDDGDARRDRLRRQRPEDVGHERMARRA